MLEYAVLTFGALFAMVDPLGAIPAFLAMTPQNSAAERQRMARTACLVAGFVMAAFAGLGNIIFKVFGITLPALQIAGGLILLLAALDMLRAQRSPLKETVEEKAEGEAKDNVAVTPLGIPMLSGPGAITTAMVLHQKAGTHLRGAVFFACLAVVMALSYAILYVSAAGAKRLSPTFMNIMERLMGILLAALGVQFILVGLKLG
ncbi:MAG: NAAT family transporter [Elusimicrobia bacterium]|nr:NAAT family transporter [Elusimicrobiota bacterium]